MPTPMNITKPGLYDRIPDDVYHSGLNTPRPSLSQSMMKALVPPSSPAKFKYRLTHPEPPRIEFDIGRAAHTTVLGVGEPMAACPADLLSTDGKMTTKAAKEWSAEQRRNGIVPLTQANYDMVLSAAEALADNERVAELLTDPTKRPEVSAYAIHPATHLWLRGRFDLLGGRLWDYKTAASAHPDDFRRSAWTYGYHIQDVWYRLLHELIVGDDPGPMGFIVQEKQPPYLVSTFVLSGEFADLARHQLDAAFDLYLACLEADDWPGYADEVITLDPPAYAWASVGVERAVEPVPIDPEFEQMLARMAGIEQ